MKTNEIYKAVTNQILELLESHQESWNRPWITFGQDSSPAKNPSTKKHYRGINQFLLSISMMNTEFAKNSWLTFKQTKDLGGHIKKGEKSTPIIFFKKSYFSKDKKYIPADAINSMSSEQYANSGIKSIPILKLYRVFNIAQAEGLDPALYEVKAPEPLQDFQKDDRAEDLLKSTGATIEITQSDQAFYSEVEDKIVLPLREQFKGQTEPFYGVALHELGHWTGHPKRLDRKGGSFGTSEYAEEELTAELCSAFCCAALGFSKNVSNNMAYIKSWIRALKQNDRAIIKAASRGQRAADYILKGTPYEVIKPSPE